MSSLQSRVLVVDDIPSFCADTCQILRDAGFDASFCTEPRQAVSKINSESYDLVITTLVMKEISGFDLIRGVRKRGNRPAIIMVTGHGTEQSATEAVRLGANDYLSKPVSPAELIARVRKALQPLADSSVAEGAYQLGNMVSQDPAMNEVFETVRKIAPTASGVLIDGETGTGKQLIAGAVHSLSDRSSEPLVELNCAAVPETLLESELFGHEKGAFTGATSRWKGRFEEAGKGTLFLDEIGEMGYNVQSKLLQVLNDGSFMRVGGEGSRKSQARIIAATNRDLQEEVDAGRFRGDLFYRLNIIRISIPPLAERPGDVSLLAELFLRRFRDSSRPEIRFAPETLEILQQYRWPGNVRELENIVERMAILNTSDVIGPDAIPERFREPNHKLRPPNRTQIWQFRAAKSQFEREWLSAILNSSRGNMAEAARRADMDRAQFFRLAKRHKMTLQSSRPQ